MNEITSLSQLDLNGSYSYGDYLKWKFQERVEIIKGKIMAISPEPNRLHQRISMKLTLELAKVFNNQQCQIYVLENGRYIGVQPVVEGDVVTSIKFPALSFDTSGLYEL